MGLIIISFVQTSKLVYECTGRACGFTSETPHGLSGEPKQSSVRWCAIVALFLKKSVCAFFFLSLVNGKQTSFCPWDLSKKSAAQLLATRIGKPFAHFLPKEAEIQEFRASYVCSERRRNQRHHRLIHDSRHLREHNCPQKRLFFLFLYLQNVFF